MTTSETGLDYYPQKVKVLVAERIKFYTLRKSGDLRKSLEIFEFDGEYPAAHKKKQNLTFVLENREKADVKHSIEKLILLNLFVYDLLPKNVGHHMNNLHKFSFRRVSIS